MTIVLLMAVPYLPLAALLVPGGGGVPLMILQDGESSTGGRVSSRGPVGDDVPDGPSTVFSKNAVRERSRDWEMKRLEGCGWHLLMTARCAVRGDAAPNDLRAVGVHADAFIEVIEKTLEGDSSDIRFSVRVFRDKADYECFASISGAKGAASFYDPRMLEAVLLWSEDGRPWRLLMHELAHAYLDRVFARREPLWLTEGFAEYFGAYAVEKGGIVKPGAPNEKQSERLRKALDDKAFVPLRRLVSASRDAFYGDGHALHYAEAGSLMMFLARSQDESRPRVLWELARGKGLHHVWDLKELEAKWIDSIKEAKK